MRVVAALAQLVEQFIRNEKVASSIPASGTKYICQVVSGSIETRTLHRGCGFFIVSTWCRR